MTKFARILEINEDNVLVGLLNDKGLCGTGACEGCSCSTKLQTMNVKVHDPGQFETGMDVEMSLSHSTAADWILLIVLPVLLVCGALLLPGFTSWDAGENTLNLTAVGTGIAGFFLGAVILRFLRKNQVIRLEVTGGK